VHLILFNYKKHGPLPTSVNRRNYNHQFYPKRNCEKNYERTESKAIGAAWLENETEESRERQETARYDEVYDVVERLATKMHRVSDHGINACECCAHIELCSAITAGKTVGL